jgi:hypothetical protein
MLRAWMYAKESQGNAPERQPTDYACSHDLPDLGTLPSSAPWLLTEPYQLMDAGCHTVAQFSAITTCSGFPQGRGVDTGDIQGLEIAKRLVNLALEGWCEGRDFSHAFFKVWFPSMNWLKNFVLEGQTSTLRICARMMRRRRFPPQYTLSMDGIPWLRW